MANRTAAMKRLFSICSDRVKAMMNGTRRILESARMSGVEIGASSTTDPILSVRVPGEEGDQCLCGLLWRLLGQVVPTRQRSSLYLLGPFSPDRQHVVP